VFPLVVLPPPLVPPAALSVVVVVVPAPPVAGCEGVVAGGGAAPPSSPLDGEGVVPLVVAPSCPGNGGSVYVAVTIGGSRSQFSAPRR
jgi:hypothetical protein